jgi:hypothetical protein
LEENQKKREEEEERETGSKSKAEMKNGRKEKERDEGREIGRKEERTIERLKIYLDKSSTSSARGGQFARKLNQITFSPSRM